MRVVIRVAIPEQLWIRASDDWHKWCNGVTEGMVEQAKRFGRIDSTWTLSLTDDLGKLNGGDPTWLQGDFRVVA